MPPYLSCLLGWSLFVFLSSLFTNTLELDNTLQIRAVQHKVEICWFADFLDPSEHPFRFNGSLFLGPRPTMSSNPRGGRGGGAGADSPFAGTSCYGKDGGICI